MKTVLRQAFVRGLVLAAAAVPVAACGGDFDPGSRVTGMRVLAVRADTPYAPPGSTVHLDTLATVPDAQRGVAWGFGTCKDPRAQTTLGCIDAMDWSTFTITEARTTPPSFDVTVPDDIITSVPAAGQPHAAVGAVVVACPGELSAAKPDADVEATGVLPFQCRD